MKLRDILVIIIVGSLCGCSPSGGDKSSGQTNGAIGKDLSRGWWQLLDDSVFTANIEPWPAKEGSATLKLEARMGDADQKFGGTVTYRIAPSSQNALPWQALPKVREDAGGNVYFQAPVTLSQGTSYVQFRIRNKGDTQPTYLEWQIEVK